MKRAVVFVMVAVASYFLLVLLALLLSGGAVSCEPPFCNAFQTFLSDTEPLFVLVAIAVSLTVGTLAARRVH